MANYCELGSRSGPMFDTATADRVADMIAKFLPAGTDARALIEEKCGRYARGKHKGELRGWATWQFVTRGGWYRRGPSYGDGPKGRVVYPGQLIHVSIRNDFEQKTYLDCGM